MSSALFVFLGLAAVAVLAFCQKYVDALKIGALVFLNGMLAAVSLLAVSFGDWRQGPALDAPASVVMLMVSVVILAVLLYSVVRAYTLFVK